MMRLGRQIREWMKPFDLRKVSDDDFQALPAPAKSCQGSAHRA